MIDFETRHIIKLQIRSKNYKIMKQQLTQIVELTCDLVDSLWNLLVDIAQKIRHIVRRCKCSIAGKIVLAAAIVAIAVIAAFLGHEYYQSEYGRVEYWYKNHEKQLSEHIETHCFKDNTTRVYNSITEKYTTSRLDWVADAPEHDTLTVFSRKGKRGFLNVNDGRIVIKAQYDKAWVFSDGLAAVVKDKKIGFVNASNEVVLPFRYDYSDRNGWAIDYLFRDGYCTMTDERGACGLIDKDGNWVVEPQYDCIWTPHGDGYRIVKDGDKYGLLNPELKFAYPLEYDYIEFSAEDAGILLSQNGRKWQVDFDGTVTRPFVVDYTSWIYVPGTYDEDEGSSKMSDYIEYRIDGQVGVLRRDNGRIVIPAIYESINILSETLFKAELREEGNWILIETNGDIVDNM